jgi:hypothetical protein
MVHRKGHNGSKRKSPRKSRTRKTSKKSRTRKTSKKTSKKKVNEYFKLMNDAKKKNLPSFVYKGKTYVAVKHPNLGTLYKSK